MNRSLLVLASFVLASCSVEERPRPTTLDELPASAIAAAPMLLNGTTWEFDDDGALTVITIDAAGHYVENRASGEHVVHGTYRQVDGKDCFTSAMGDKSVSCWTAVPQTKIGESARATSAKGYTATFKRVPYRELKIGG